MASPCQSTTVSIAGHLDLRNGDKKLIDERYRAWLKTPRGRRQEAEQIPYGGAFSPRANQVHIPKTRAEVGFTRRNNRATDLRARLVGLPSFTYHDLIRRCGFSTRESATVRLRVWKKQGVVHLVDGTCKPFRYSFA